MRTTILHLLAAKLQNILMDGLRREVYRGITLVIDEDVDESSVMLMHEALVSLEDADSLVMNRIRSRQILVYLHKRGHTGVALPEARVVKLNIDRIAERYRDFPVLSVTSIFVHECTHIVIWDRLGRRTRCLHASPREERWCCLEEKHLWRIWGKPESQRGKFISAFLNFTGTEVEGCILLDWLPPSQPSPPSQQYNDDPGKK